MIGVVFFNFFKERNPFCVFFLNMSSAQIIDTLVAEASGSAAEGDKYRKLIDSAVLEVTTLLGVTQDSMNAISECVEAASTRDGLKKSFKRLNNI